MAPSTPPQHRTMTTRKNDHTTTPHCMCAPKVGNSHAWDHIVPVTWLDASLIQISAGAGPNLDPAESSPAATGASAGRSCSFESLKHALSSRDGRESLYALPIERAVEVIDVLEQGSREGSPLCAHHRKRFSMALRKMCREHKRLPPSYMITYELSQIGEPCGRGGNADVWRGVYQGSRVAIKTLRVDPRVDLVSLEREFCCKVVLWKQFKHQNLLPLVGAKWSPQSLMMISEWMEHGTIMDFVIAHPETNRLKLLADVARGLKYLHDWPSVHADLKGNNILIDSNHSARIADFGLTSLLSHPSISISITAPTLGGTLQWMAPELFDGRSRPSRESDVYAFGMVIYEVFAQERPFSHVLHYAAPGLALAGMRPSRPTNFDILGLSNDVWTLTEKCWHQVPSTRPHIADNLAFFETAARGWAPPTPEVIANLSFGRSTSQNGFATESTDTMPGTTRGTIRVGAVSLREAGQWLPASKRVEVAATI